MSFIDWDFQLLEEFIQDRGDQVIWETGIACSACRRDDATISFNETTPNQVTRIRRVNCPVCNGYGFLYRNATVVTGLLTQVNAGNRQLIDIGLAMPGDCVFSPSLQADKMQDMDKITLFVADVLHEGQVIQRGGAKLSNAALTQDTLLDNEDRLWYAGDGTAIWCEDQNQRVYDVGADFFIIDNKISWVGNQPDVGIFYTLKYSYFPEWIVYSSPLERVDRGRNLQQRVVIRKKHTAYINAQDTVTPAQRQEAQLESTGRIRI